LPHAKPLYDRCGWRFTLKALLGRLEIGDKNLFFGRILPEKRENFNSGGTYCPL